MRLLTLELRAFGPFTDVTLDFGRESVGSALHVVFGQNEAGKSSALRALTGFFYGIPPRTDDDHVHRKDQLRVGARVLTPDGRELHLVRRKGLKNTLLDPDGEAADEALLTAALAGVGRGQFTTMFGLDHEALRRGVDDMLAGRGDVGESLYDAGVGGRGIHEVLRQLEEEADALFTPRGKKKLLNESIESFKALRLLERERALRVESYEAQRAALAEARQRWDTLDERRRDLYRERDSLARRIAVLPDLRLRQDVARRRDALGPVAPIARDGPRRREEAQRDLREAEVRIGALARDVERLRTRRDELIVPEALAALAEETVGAIEEGLGRHRSAAKDRPRRVGKRDSLADDIRARLRAMGRDVDLGEVDSLRVRPELVVRIRTLANRHTGLSASVRHADKAVRERRQALDELVRRRDALPTPSNDSRTLRHALAEARALGHAGERRDALTAAIEEEARALEAIAARVGAGSRETLAALSPSEPAVLDRLDEVYRELRREEEAIASRRRELEVERRQIERDLSALAHAGDVPDEEQLTEARARRDVAFRDLPGAAPERFEAFERLVGEADAIADRLRREAERVARKAGLLADREAANAEAEGLDRRARTADARAREIAAEISAASVGTSASTLPELRVVARAIDDARHLERTLGGHLAERSRLDERVAAAEASLARALGVDEVGLRTGVRDAELLLETADSIDTRRRELDRAVAETEAQLRQLEAEADAARAEQREFLEEWTRSVTALELDAAATPDEANEVLDRLAELFAQVDKMGELSRRIDGIDRDAHDFGEQVGRLVERHAADLGDAPIEEQAQAILARYQRARADLTKRAEIEDELTRKVRELTEAEALRDGAKATLEELCAYAGVDDVDALRAAEALAVAAREHEEEMASVERRLIDRSDGLTLDALTAECEDAEIADLRMRKEDVDRELEEVDEERRQATHDIATREEGLKQLQKMSAAATADDAQAQLARIHTLTRRYARTRLSAALLRREIERYREENQGPILSRANELFPRLTLGAYTGLRVGFGAGDDEVLRCVRPDGGDVGVEGLSEGTRYQLYLALRLATLERHLEHNPPMPFVLDDALIHFDDDRARAALELLGELAGRTQVLFFTHHTRLVDLAREAVPAVRLREHDLAKARAARGRRRRKPASA